MQISTLRNATFPASQMHRDRTRSVWPASRKYRHCRPSSRYRIHDVHRNFARGGPCPPASSSLRRLPQSLDHWRSEEHTSELQSLMRTSYAVFSLKKNKKLIYIPVLNSYT